MRYLIVFFFFVVIQSQLFSQKVWLSKDLAYVGEKLMYYINVDSPTSIQNKSFIPDKQFMSVLEGEIKKETKNLEIVQVYDTVLNNGKTWKLAYTFYTWDEGNYTIAPTEVKLNGQVFNIQSVQLKVVYPEDITNGEIIDTDIMMMDYEPTEDYTFWMWIGVVVMLVLLMLIYLRIKKNRKKEVTLSDQLSLFERSIIRLTEMRQRKIIDQAALTEIYIGLSNELKNFIENEYSISLKDKTTSEIELLFIQLQLDKNVVEDLIALLRRSDMVKFAQSLPSVNERDMDFQQAIFLLQKLVKDV